MQAPEEPTRRTAKESAQVTTGTDWLDANIDKQSGGERLTQSQKEEEVVERHRKREARNLKRQKVETKQKQSKKIMKEITTRLKRFQRSPQNDKAMIEELSNLTYMLTENVRDERVLAQIAETAETIDMNAAFEETNEP